VFGLGKTLSLQNQGPRNSGLLGGAVVYRCGTASNTNPVLPSYTDTLQPSRPDLSLLDFDECTSETPSTPPPVSNPPIIETLLPYLSGKAQVLVCPERKTSFDELQRPLKSQKRRNQKMKMIGHEHKFHAVNTFLEIGSGAVHPERVLPFFRIAVPVASERRKL
jgi:hypothetical protein